ncbi:MAG: DUF4294 domain-containing protein [Bacteroidales bacterium]|nr:DUF4294 domain-containing protein [Bacteroidales bacterium]
MKLVVRTIHIGWLAVFLLSGYSAMAQKQDAPADTLNKKDRNVLKAEEVNGETIATIEVQEVVVFPKIEFDSRRKYRRYRKLIRDLKIVYPYAQKAKYKLIEMERDFRKLESEKARKQYVKKMEKEIKEEFTNDIKHLTINQGRLLLKLIDRETGNTSYTLLDELKGSFTAVFWQTVARIFGHNLKAEYEPHGRDYLIERIVVLIEHNQI